MSVRFKKSREIAAPQLSPARNDDDDDDDGCAMHPQKATHAYIKSVPLSLQSRTLPSSPPYRRFCTSRISLSRVGLYRTPVCSRRGGPLQNSSFMRFVCALVILKRQTMTTKKHESLSSECMSRRRFSFATPRARVCVCIYI